MFSSDQFREVFGHPGVQIIAATLLAMLVSSVLRRMLNRATTTHHLSRISAARLIVGMRWLSVIVLVLITLQITGVVAQAWAILSATIAALAVGFVATWSVLSNVTSALLLMSVRPFRVGDDISVLEGDKILVTGKVLDLNLIFTTILEGETASRVPNNFFLQKVVRVSRNGAAPDPLEDSTTPFFEA